MRQFRNLVALIVGLFLGGFVVVMSAQAQGLDTLLNPNVINGTSSSGTLDRLMENPFRPSTDHIGGVDRTGSTGFRLGGIEIPIDSKSSVTPNSLARGAAQAAKLFGPAVVASIVLDLVWNEALKRWEVENDIDNASGTYAYVYDTTSCGSSTNLCTTARQAVAANFSGTAFSVSTASEFQTRIAAALSLQAAQTTYFGTTYRISGGEVTSCNVGSAGTCTIKVKYSNATTGAYVSANDTNVTLKMIHSSAFWCSGEGMGRDRTTGYCVPETRPATDGELEQEIRDGLVGTPSGAPEVLRRTIDAGQDVDYEPLETSGPDSVPGESTTTTTTGPDGTTTKVRERRYDVDYNGDTVTVTETVTETTTNPDGSTEVTETTTSPAPGQEPEQSGDDEQYSLDYSDTEWPPIPDLYEQQYPDGFAGVWDQRKSELEGTSLFSLATSITSGVPGGGTCPSWSVNLDMPGVVMLGTHVIAPPCEVWPFVRAVMILTALFVARRLVFGG